MSESAERPAESAAPVESPAPSAAEAPSDEGDPLEKAWAELLGAWEQEEKHKAFVALASALDRLADAAKRYRTLEKDPERAAGVEAGKQRVLALALARMESMPHTEKDARAMRRRYVAPVGAYALLLVLDAVATAVLHSRTPLSWPVLLLELLAVAVLPWRRLTS